MSCDKSECKCEDLVVPQQGLAPGLNAADVQASLLGFGFGLDEIKEVINRYGTAVVGLLLEGLRAGFTKDWILGLLDKVGKAGLEFIIDLVNQNSLFAAAAAANGCQKAHAIPAVTGVPAEQFGGILDGALVQLLIDKYLPELVEKYAPQLLEKLAPKLIEFLVSALQQWLTVKAAEKAKAASF